MIRSLIYSSVTLLTVMAMAEAEWITLNHVWLKKAHLLCLDAVTSLWSLI